MQYVIEYHLLASGERQHPQTRVMVIEATSMFDAMSKAIRRVSIGPDCVKVTITEVTEDKK